MPVRRVAYIVLQYLDGSSALQHRPMSASREVADDRIGTLAVVDNVHPTLVCGSADVRVELSWGVAFELLDEWP